MKSLPYQKSSVFRAFDKIKGLAEMMQLIYYYVLLKALMVLMDCIQNIQCTVPLYSLI